ncbi:MAG: MlrC C-terminal domain-containing protein, partial [Rhodoferax sp.]|nr:MlrC C-terminal domain-containing protein [Rhodoferax sp.]
AQEGNRTAARALACELAQAVWQQRQRFVSQLTPLADAVHAAVLAGCPGGQPLILADVADNPGGGGGGNTIALLQALINAGAQDVLLGVFTDPALAREAHALGVGTAFTAQFNRDSADAVFAPALSHPAQVLTVSDGNFVGRRGMVSGSRQAMGPSALLDLGGVRVAVISQRQQLIDPAQLDILGVDLTTVRTLVAKSRGHFRAAFADFAPADRILEVDCPGLTTPNLATLAWTRLPRPIFPLDPDLDWNP